MRLKALAIARRESWESNSGSLNGSVKLEDEGGEVVVNLSPGAIARLVGVIAQEVTQRAQKDAQLVRSGMAEAADECLLIESDGIINGELAKLPDGGAT